MGLAPPELEAVTGLMIPNQIRGDVHQPRCETGASPELITAFVGPHETILNQVFGSFPIAERS